MSISTKEQTIKLKEKIKSKITKKNLTITISAVVIVLILSNMFGSKKAGVTTEMVGVLQTRQSLVTSIDNSGVIEPLEQYDILAQVSAEILSDYIEIGAEVTKDQLLYVIDNTDALDSITKSENNLARQQNSYNDLLDTQSDYYIKPSVSGVITEVYVAVGDKISANTKIADVVDTSSLKITLPFMKTDAENIYNGQSATLYINTGEQLLATVTNVANGEYITSSGTFACDVEFIVSNPGVLTEDYTATAMIGNASSADSANFVYINKESITSSVSGDLLSINIVRGDKVTPNTVICEVSNSNSWTSLENSRLSLEDTYLSHQTTLDSLEDYNITSPINGKIMEKMYKAGDTLKTANTNLAVVADMSKVKFDMQVDEMNIHSVQIGQTVEITADAVDGIFIGEVTSIGLMGTQSSGVTTYTVTVEIEEYGMLLPGMNINAEIICASVDDALTIPSNYITRGNMVLISTNDASKYKIAQNIKMINPGEIYETDTGIDGYVYLSVEVGMSDGQNVQIISGLNEDTEVFMQVTTSNAQNSQNSNFEFGGGMSSGMNSGMTNSAFSERQNNMTK